MKWIIVTVISAWLVTAPFADTHYVSLEGGNQSPYTTWQNAANNIQSAVDAATVGDTVLVSNGTYLISTQIVVTNKITLLGLNGYSNTLVAADWPAYTTRCVTVSGTSVIDGLSFSNGHVLSSITNDNGGGMWANGGTKIQNCWFGFNYCSNSTEVANGLGGGGLWISNGIVSNCVFYSNTAFLGGGAISAYLNSPVKVTHSTIISNIVFLFTGQSAFGGGVWGAGGNAAACVISNSLIANNNFSMAGGNGYGGGIHACWITHSILRNNSANSGGGMYKGYASNTIIEGNIATAAGGGATASSATLVIYGCDIIGNIASQGGGVRINIGSQNQKIQNCTISNNSAVTGGGLFCQNGGVVLNCIINNNTNTSSISWGGGAYLNNFSSGTVPGSLENCTITDNYSSNDCGGVYVMGSTNLIYNCVIAGNRSFSNKYTDVYTDATRAGTNCFYNCLVGVTDLVVNADNRNIYGDPKFKNPAGDYRLAADSACVNAGTNRSWITNALDLTGSIRIRYGTVDMGAYEVLYQGLLFQAR